MIRFCELAVDASGRIQDYCLRMPDHRRKAVEAFQGLKFDTFAAGDSYNDLSMIDAADNKALFCPPQRLIDERSDLSVAHSHADLKALISNIL